MCAAVGHPVTRLVRSRIGPIVDTNLGPGEWRDLERDELRAIETMLAEGLSDQDG